MPLGRQLRELTSLRSSSCLTQSHEVHVQKQLAERRERERVVLHKALEDNYSFSKMAEEKLSYKMEVNKENREARFNALKQKLREKVRNSSYLQIFQLGNAWHFGAVMNVTTVSLH